MTNLQRLNQMPQPTRDQAKYRILLALADQLERNPSSEQALLYALGFNRATILAYCKETKAAHLEQARALL